MGNTIKISGETLKQLKKYIIQIKVNEKRISELNKELTEKSTIQKTKTKIIKRKNGTSTEKNTTVNILPIKDDLTTEEEKHYIRNRLKLLERYIREMYLAHDHIRELFTKQQIQYIIGDIGSQEKKIVVLEPKEALKLFHIQISDSFLLKGFEQGKDILSMLNFSLNKSDTETKYWKGTQESRYKDVIDNGEDVTKLANSIIDISSQIANFPQKNLGGKVLEIIGQMKLSRGLSAWKNIQKIANSKNYPQKEFQQSQIKDFVEKFIKQDPGNLRYSRGPDVIGWDANEGYQAKNYGTSQFGASININTILNINQEILTLFQEIANCTVQDPLEIDVDELLNIFTQKGQGKVLEDGALKVADDAIQKRIKDLDKIN